MSTSVASRMRASKRIRINIVDEVKNSHEPINAVNKLLKSHQYPDDCLDVDDFCKLCRKYKKVLLQNKKCLSTILIKCIKVHWIHEDVGLTCVKELIETYGALINYSFGSFEGVERSDVTALYIASAYGMVDVVNYLLKKGANIRIPSTGRFSLFSDPSRTIYGTYTPLTLAAEMRALEMKESTFGNYESQFFTQILRVLAEHNIDKSSHACG